ncbi:MAG: hypothetical protein KJO54_04140 [Gammaproteobacteria bacterium]|nr:hypothetical protein [Gammaproteobacteria bacterium]NNF62290.1 hypothetical protein [Gammaproteobacteria bacterium]NNM21243.1 hypothetical protein [Gammaproteobacteria bacterium]
MKLIIFILLGTALSACDGPHSGCNEGDGRLLKSSEKERSYLAIARDSGMYQLCSRIDARAYGEWALNPPGEQIALTRSRCYFESAIYNNNPKLCDSVKQISADDLDGSKYSPAHCRAAADSRPRKPVLAVSKRQMAGFLSDLGFAPSALVKECSDFLSSLDEGWQNELPAAAAPGATAAIRIRAIRDHLFGPFNKPRHQRPHWYCELLYDVRASPAGSIEISLRPTDEATDRFQDAAHDVYRTKLANQQLAGRVDKLPCTRSSDVPIRSSN